MVLKRDGDGVQFCGSGFIAHRDGYVLTAAHNVNLTDTLAIAPVQPIDQFAPRTLTQVTAIPVRIAQFDAVNDVALLQMTNGTSFVTPNNWMGRGETVNVGAVVGCLGIPFGSRGLHSPKLSYAIICGKSLSEEGTKQLHLDSNIHEGNSGGPIIEAASGQIIGIVTGRFSPVGTSGGLTISGFGLGQDSTISFGSPIEYAAALMTAEGINV